MEMHGCFGLALVARLLVVASFGANDFPGKEPAEADNVLTVNASAQLLASEGGGSPATKGSRKSSKQRLLREEQRIGKADLVQKSNGNALATEGRQSAGCVLGTWRVSLFADKYCNLFDKDDIPLCNKNEVNVRVQAYSCDEIIVAKVESCSPKDFKCVERSCGHVGVLRLETTTGELVDPGTYDRMLSCADNKFTIWAAFFEGTHVFSRAGSNKYCNGRVDSLKDFIARGSSDSHIRAARNQCEAYCAETLNCWGCTASIKGDKWSAISSCDRRDNGRTRITGAVSQKLHVGPRVSKKAGVLCSAWSGTLLDAVEKCDGSSCSVLYSNNCDDSAWQFCLPTIRELQATGTDFSGCTLYPAVGTFTYSRTAPHYCEMVDEFALMTFTALTPNDDHKKSALHECERYCATQPYCWGCSVKGDCSKDVGAKSCGDQWSALEACIGKVPLLTNKISGDVSQKLQIGPRVGTVAAKHCSQWYGTLESATEACMNEADCFTVHDDKCDGQNWRFCKGSIDVLQKAGGGFDACTLIVQPGCSHIECGIGEKMRKTMPNFCEAPLCRQDECCVKAATCSTSVCTKGKVLLSPFALPKACANDLCTEEECCENVGGFTYGRTKGERCDFSSHHLLEEFIPKRPTRTEYTDALQKCESFCQQGTSCWGCTISCSTKFCQWNAISDCLSLVRWTGMLDGDVSKKFLIGPKVNSWSARELSCSRATFNLFEASVECSKTDTCSVLFDASCTRQEWHYCTSNILDIRQMNSVAKYKQGDACTLLTKGTCKAVTCPSGMVQKRVSASFCSSAVCTESECCSIKSTCKMSDCMRRPGMVMKPFTQQPKFCTSTPCQVSECCQKVGATTFFHNDTTSCILNDADVLKTFPTSSLTTGHLIRSRGKCEEFCTKAADCWGCSVNCSSMEHCQWVAMYKCHERPFVSSGVAKISYVIKHIGLGSDKEFIGTVSRKLQVGPHVSGNAHVKHCSAWTGTAMEAISKCSNDEFCSTIYDEGCDFKGWRYCSRSVSELMAVPSDLKKSVKSQACVFVTQANCNSVGCKQETVPKFALPRFCEGPVCTIAECCGPAPLCREDDCTGSSIPKPSLSIPRTCRATVCTEEECCDTVASYKFSRSSEHYCALSDVNTLHEFRPTSLNDVDAVDARDRCEKFCAADARCWGCSLNSKTCTENCFWSAIPSCGVERNLGGAFSELSGSISQKLQIGPRVSSKLAQPFCSTETGTLAEVAAKCGKSLMCYTLLNRGCTYDKWTHCFKTVTELSAIARPSETMWKMSGNRTGLSDTACTMVAQGKCKASMCTDGSVLRTVLPLFCMGFECTKDECCGGRGTCSADICPPGSKMKQENPTFGTCLGDRCTEEECCVRDPGQCTNNPDVSMLVKRLQCDGYDKVRNCEMCRHNPTWVKQKTCQFSCYLAGCGYEGDVCNLAGLKGGDNIAFDALDSDKNGVVSKDEFAVGATAP